MAASGLNQYSQASERFLLLVGDALEVLGGRAELSMSDREGNGARTSAARSVISRRACSGGTRSTLISSFSMYSGEGDSFKSALH